MKSQLQKGAELWLSKVLRSKTLFFLTQNQSCIAKIFQTLPKGTTPDAGEHCIQIWSPNSKRGLRSSCPKFWVQKLCFSPQNQSCMPKIFRHPQKALPLIMENIVSKDEVPTPKGGWVMAVQVFIQKRCFLTQNQSCMAKIFRHPQKALLLMLENIVSKFEVPTPKGDWVMAVQLNCLNIEEEE